MRAPGEHALQGELLAHAGVNSVQQLQHFKVRDCGKKGVRCGGGGGGVVERKAGVAAVAAAAAAAVCWGRVDAEWQLAAAAAEGHTAREKVCGGRAVMSCGTER